jgi:lipoprotein-anchoring transpeptidase ErfK/SrfK
VSRPLAHGKSRPARWPWITAVGIVLAAVLAAGVTYAVTRHSSSSPTAIGPGPGPGAGSGGPATSRGPAAPTTTRPAVALAVQSTSPGTGARSVASDASVSIRFSTPIASGTVLPSIRPPVAGTWRQTTATELRFTPKRSLVPYRSETVTVPKGLRAADGTTLGAPVAFHFTVASGSTLRLQELLAELDYLPLSFTPSGATRSPQETALPQRGRFAWRWAGTPSELKSQWASGTANVITKGAVMSFEKQAGLDVDGLAGPGVWNDLLADKAADRTDPTPYTYVLVSKARPETLTLYDNGATKFAGIQVNTGAPGADTTDGTYPVFEHVTFSAMKGTNPDGSTYDDPHVPWASFFDHGDALHGFVRAQYGFPQSNGCVEMPVATARMLWPYTPIGTLVTVTGPKVT